LRQLAVAVGDNIEELEIGALRWKQKNQPNPTILHGINYGFIGTQLNVAM